MIGSTHARETGRSMWRGVLLDWWCDWVVRCMAERPMTTAPLDNARQPPTASCAHGEVATCENIKAMCAVTMHASSAASSARRRLYHPCKTGSACSSSLARSVAVSSTSSWPVSPTDLRPRTTELELLMMKRAYPSTRSARRIAYNTTAEERPPRT